ncbi:MAG: transporter substrate-binding protein, partial [Phycisphaerales bacterium]|nr:transporter substrate-binding protein [Phycisphaerales bacterium]
MENRFGIKDLFLFLAIGLLTIVVAGAIWQFDRQHDRVQELNGQTKNLATDLNTVKTRLNEVLDGLDELKRRPAGVAAAVGAPSASRPAGSQPAVAAGNGPPPGVDAFTRVKEAEKLPGFARGDWLVDNFGTKVGRLTPLISSDIYQTWVESQ